MLRTGEWECGFSIDGGWILMEDDSLCGGRTLQEGLHARFARMHIWAVTRYTSNGRMGMRIFDRWWMDFGGG
ncbi:TPA: hypothetical protein LCR19_002958 [Listeria monocytogenes]|nr:hypothetical protein [Listeria monocytogenes]EAF5585313.1 hypothetical protein [Listeria monocytogenes]EAF5771402.1 hypothetical protein [Listeria monocytogenes]EAG6302234.1 hypothetical protein [Listeria monocytogenes]EAK9286907.1 hypothetical protein [Listeria monocytogenes]